ncbi:hypothetical protein Barb7_00783 [Bacteroidales bacterium Barb7]|nr:hypothetical protein Barb7_00783 [Bacteroidales bacterium Barb7]
MTLLPTDACIFNSTFSSKLKNVRLRARSGSEGSFVVLLFMPSVISAEPCVFTRTPPGPKTFSAAPMSNCISAILNALPASR